MAWRPDDRGGKRAGDVVKWWRYGAFAVIDAPLADGVAPAQSATVSDTSRTRRNGAFGGEVD